MFLSAQCTLSSPDETVQSLALTVNRSAEVVREAPPREDICRCILCWPATVPRASRNCTGRIHPAPHFVDFFLTSHTWCLLLLGFDLRVDAPWVHFVSADQGRKVTGTVHGPIHEHGVKVSKSLRAVDDQSTPQSAESVSKSDNEGGQQSSFAERQPSMGRWERARQPSRRHRAVARDPTAALAREVEG